MYYLWRDTKAFQRIPHVVLHIALPDLHLTHHTHFEGELRLLFNRNSVNPQDLPRTLLMKLLPSELSQDWSPIA